MKKVIKIRNLDCAACAAELQEELAGLEGVSEVSVDFVGQRVTLSHEGDQALERAIRHISSFEEVEIVDGNAPQKKERHLKELLSIAVSAAFFIPALVLHLIGGYDWIAFGLFLASFAAAGWSVVLSVGRNLVRAFRNGFHPGVLLDENLLMLIAAVGAFAIRQDMEGAIVMLLYQIGEYLQGLAVGSSRGAITRLMSLKSDSAIRLTDGEQQEVDPEDLRPGDVILLRRGDKVPADCRLLDESASLDTKSMTGESYLKEVRKGGEMLSGCVNEGNAVRAEVLRPVSESAVAKILELVENSASQKAKPEKFITRFSRWYTPIVVLIAVIVAVVPPLFQNYNFGEWIVPALNFLVISCPCALIISVPLTYFSGVGTLARYGVLAKGAVYLDNLAAVKTAAFDKTGTLTEGKFTVGKINGQDRVLQLAAAVERASSHPLAQAFEGVDCPAAERVEELAGRGLKGFVNGKTVLVGSYKLMREQGIVCEEFHSAALVVYVAEDGAFLGSVEIEDRLRPEAKEALEGLKRAGVGTIAVLTGDTKARAQAALAGLPVDEICSELLPQEKPERAQQLRQGGKLMYVGDGINDTPVMTVSDVSVAMGGLGSDAAIEASDFVLATDNLNALPKAVKGAKKTKKIVIENIVFSIAIKVVLMILSLLGLLPLWIAVFGDTGVMLLAVLNSMRMRAKIK
ncbi:MAG TPA: cadmium-translocating P-type ATPase [Firmicutes bacterium]|nr:cadmium-translocating P-type ATPase [Bacillota bacterium]